MCDKEGHRSKVNKFSRDTTKKAMCLSTDDHSLDNQDDYLYLDDQDESFHVLRTSPHLLTW